jgi:hypothetical protein
VTWWNYALWILILWTYQNDKNAPKQILVYALEERRGDGCVEEAIWSEGGGGEMCVTCLCFVIGVSLYGYKINKQNSHMKTKFSQH